MISGEGAQQAGYREAVPEHGMLAGLSDRRSVPLGAVERVADNLAGSVDVERLAGKDRRHVLHRRIDHEPELASEHEYDVGGLDEADRRAGCIDGIRFAD